jgi:predicted  nucleic acid-binding Zn-ribbon protein
MTERLSLFRQQALAPYKRALWILTILFILAIAGLVAWNILQAKKFDEEIQNKQKQIELVNKNLDESDELIEALNDELINTQNASYAERARIQQKLEEAQAEREVLLMSAAALKEELDQAANDAVEAGQNAEALNDQVQALQERLDEAAKAAEKKAAEEAAAKEKELNIIGKDAAKAPELKSESKGGLKKF